MLTFFDYFLAAAFLQNVVLMTGFGSSVLIKSSRKRTNILPFGALLCLFTTLTVLICYPLDILIGTGVVAKWLRPLMIISITAVLYVIVVITLNKRFPSLYRRIKRLIPVAAFNNLVIGIAIIINHQFAVSFLGAVGLSLGTCAGFLLLSWLSTEGIERLDNPDVPKAFRGLPSILIYLGILSLALMGFSGSVSILQ
ncbi:MAG TPA: Rnf-Nqr domain containing protein [Candidatus Avimonas sp.]|jgi:electron transport complex protein RnfA|nr:Rnf-Nqr domain containing protein [Candidatus Avimonas sp.]HQA16329.1 Rnf-Nqr domain containing protein [Candidatus Avimonas sp.]HQD38551.1 Rnf-Nqr domain containing protein [Candidatus Avimonas sp.]